MSILIMMVVTFGIIFGSMIVSEIVNFRDNKRWSAELSAYSMARAERKKHYKRIY